MTERYLARWVIPAAFELLPPRMRSRQAAAMLIAIAVQEARRDGVLHRRQVGGPARGFYQFERTGIAGVLGHEATRVEIGIVLTVLCYRPTVDACHAGIEDNDILATVFARLLLWTLPASLPTREETQRAWLQYLDAWRPGAFRAERLERAAHPPKWARSFREGWDHVDAYREMTGG